MEPQMRLAEGDTIAAVATPAGTGGIAVIRVSGSKAIEIVGHIWLGRSLDDIASHSARFGRILDIEGNVLDEVVVTVFRGPSSFTGEDTVEISCHGSQWIQREILRRLVDCGARVAGPGEFSQRAFLNGRIDLAQAEGIADLISASSRAAHKMAVSQINGHFSQRITQLRERMVDLASLLELELDFSEEDVEFADRSKLRELASETLDLIDHLVRSYSAGAVLKDGVPVVIAGVPNSGKSTLLNTFIGDERAIVSDIPGTTRDIIEATAEIDGVLFRFYDTAGLRSSADKVERIGIEKASEKMSKARIILWIINPQENIESQVEELRKRSDRFDEDAKLFIVINKSDLLDSAGIERIEGEIGREFGDRDYKVEELRAYSEESVARLGAKISEEIKSGYNPDTDLIVTNARHEKSLREASESLKRSIEAIDAGLSGDLIAIDIRSTLHHLGEITGAITPDTLLSTIFSRFCVGK